MVLVLPASSVGGAVTRRTSIGEEVENMTRIIRSGHARIIATSAGAFVAALAVGVPSAGAAATPAQKMPLTQTNRTCDSTVIPPERTQPFGFAVVTKPAKDKLVAAVALKGALPNTAYNIRLIQILPDDADCHTVDGTLTTDAFGNGNANVQEPVLPGATSVWVDLNGQINPDNFYDTAPVSF